MYGQKVAEAIGLQPKIGGVWDQGGASNIMMISYAVDGDRGRPVRHRRGLLRRQPEDRDRRRATAARAATTRSTAGSPPLSAYAMIARRHMGELGTRREEFGAVAVASRRHGAQNPNAQLRKPLTLDEYMALPPMVAPFCRDDCALVSDGAAAVVVMSAERAKEMGVKKPVPILGFGHGQTSWEVPQRPDMTSTQAKIAGRDRVQDGRAEAARTSTSRRSTTASPSPC